MDKQVEPVETWPTFVIDIWGTVAVCLVWCSLTLNMCGGGFDALSLLGTAPTLFWAWYLFIRGRRPSLPSRILAILGVAIVSFVFLKNVVDVAAELGCGT